MPATFIVQLENESGALERFAALVRRRGFKIRSLTTGESHAGQTLRITMEVEGSEVASGIHAFLQKLPSVKRVDTVSPRECLLRQLAIMKVAATRDERAEIMQIARVFRARIIDISRGSMILEATGTAAKIRALIEELAIYGIIEVARTGRIAMFRGIRTTAPNQKDPIELDEAAMNSGK